MAGKRTAFLEFAKASVAVRDVISELATTFPLSFKRALIDPVLNDPRPNVIVLLNRMEIGLMDGIATRIGDGDKLVLVPVSHGG